MSCKNIYKSCVFIFGLIPATFWFLIETYYTLGLLNNISNYWVWFLFYAASFLGALGFWVAMFFKNKAIKPRLSVVFMMCIGVATTLFVYFSEPRFFKGFEWVVFSPVVIAVIVIWVNLKVIFLKFNGVKIKTMYL